MYQLDEYALNGNKNIKESYYVNFLEQGYLVQNQRLKKAMEQKIQREKEEELKRNDPEAYMRNRKAEIENKNKELER